jgi:PEGA domain
MNGDFAGALTKYQQAYEASQDARLLYQMAISEKNLRHYARMQAFLSRYLREGGAAIPPANRAAVEAALGAIKDLVVTINVTVSEPGASVSVDGAPVGTSPLATAIIVDLGRHNVGAKKAGFEPVDQAVEGAGGTSPSLTLRLVAAPHVAQLVLTSDESSTVSLDGRVVGKGHFEGRVAPGIHDVRVTDTGKRPYQAQIELHDGETRTMQVTLEAQAHGAALWPWVAGGVALAAGAVVGGYFLFKSPDQGASEFSGSFGTVHLSSFR